MPPLGVPLSLSAVSTYDCTSSPLPPHSSRHCCRISSIRSLATAHSLSQGWTAVSYVQDMFDWSPVPPTWVVEEVGGTLTAKAMVSSPGALDRLTIIPGIALHWFSTGEAGSYQFRPFTMGQTAGYLVEPPTVTSAEFYEHFHDLGCFFDDGAAVELFDALS